VRRRLETPKSRGALSAQGLKKPFSLPGHDIEKLKNKAKNLYKLTRTHNARWAHPSKKMLWWVEEGFVKTLSP